MDLLNEYKVIYVAEREGDEGRQLYASKILQGIEEEKLTAYDNGETEIPDLHIFKLIYSNGEWYEYLMGSETGLPTENDVNIVFKDSQGTIVYGKVKESPEPKYEVTVGEIANATVTGAGQYQEGEEVTISIQANEGYRFEEAPTCDACELTESEGVYSGTFEMPAEDVSVAVSGSVVEVPTYEVTVNEIANATVEGAGNYEEGATVTITITPNEGYVFTEAPTADQCEFAENEGSYVGTFAMPAEAVAVSVTGAPVLDTAGKIFYHFDANEITAPDEDWDYEAIPEEVENMTHGYTFEEAGRYYVAFAVPANSNVTRIEQNAGGMWFDVTEAFSSTDVTFNGNAFKLFVTNDTSAVVDVPATDEYKFYF